MIDALCSFFCYDKPLKVEGDEFYPSYIQRIFDKHHFPGESLPARGIGTLAGEKSNHFHYIFYKDLPSAVSRIEDDHKRRGLALTVFRKSVSPFEATNIPVVLLLFPVEENGELIWKANNFCTIGQELTFLHEQEGHFYGSTCSSCPFSAREPINGALLEKLFTGAHPYLGLVSPLGQPYELFPEVTSTARGFTSFMHFLGLSENKKHD